MVDNIGFIISDTSSNQVGQNEKENIKKIIIISKTKKVSLYQKYSKIINVTIFEFILILLPKTIFSKNYMKIKVNKEGYNQIISDDYRDSLPSKISVNNKPKAMDNKIVYVESIKYIIYLEWPNDKTEINVVYMFSNLTNIISVEMDIFGLNGNMSYMFYNCTNLEQFTYGISYKRAYAIQDMRSMFYNCYSLKNFNFKNIYINYYDYIYGSIIGYIYNNFTGKNETIYEYIYNYHNVNLSYMFYNCKSLESINFGSHYLTYINDMKGLFYNCFSLKSIDLNKIQTTNNVDLSYMFYNCSSLKKYSNKNNIDVKDMRYMFYNCSSLTQISSNTFKRDSPLFFFNMSNLFYNCYNLKSFPDFRNLYINDAREMFYNCMNLSSFDLKFTSNVDINMTKMFYNCIRLKKLILKKSNNLTIFPNDLSYAFYNCISLSSLTLNYFKTDNLKEISYMMYNCKILNFFSLDNSIFSNNLIKNMRGIFQNCESIVSLNLTSFYTPQVEIMWDMFKGCRNLEVLKIQNFNTSNVIDMESMFEGCSSLTSLNLSNFRTTKVHYMNKMFKNCINLQRLEIEYFTSDKLGTMQQMFYNCQNLRYLNIFSLNENDQSVLEMFKGVSNNFIFCVEDSEKIPKIYNEIILLSNTIRDCSEKCYGPGKNRASIKGNKLCCPFYEFNGFCYDKCPPRTRSDSSKTKNCINFTCTNYYNFSQEDCIDELPNGYYVNDSKLRTIDKCPENCKTCEKKANQTRISCLSCNDNFPFLYLGECLISCVNNGSYTNDSGILKCRCFTNECKDCTEESLEEGSCLECNDGYFPKLNATPNSNNFTKCYKDPPKYYFDNGNKIYKPCYPSCEKCNGDGNDNFHNCLICDSNKIFAVKYLNKNCYENCTYYYYFDNDNKYRCTEKDECPNNFKFLIVDLGQCVKSCNTSLRALSEYNKVLRYGCYKKCPSIISKPRKKNPNLCGPLCTYESPFELVEEEKCVASCSIMERSKKLCITNYYGNRTNLEIQELIHVDIQNDLENNFDYTIITENQTILIKENQTFYEIVTTRNKNPNSIITSVNLGECETRLKEYYEIEQDQYLYMLVIDAFIEGKTGPTTLYEVYYPLLNSPTLFKLDLSICKGIKISFIYNMNLENLYLYDKNNPIYNDICHPYSSKDGVDMSLIDRQNEYKNNNRTICDDGCELNTSNKNNIECNCDIKNSTLKMTKLENDKDKLYKFTSIKNIANFDVLKCINLLTVKERMISNIGIYLFIPTFIAYIVCLFSFYKRDFQIIKGKIKDLLYAIQKLKYFENQLNKVQLNKKAPDILIILKKKKIINNKIRDNNIKSSCIRLYNPPSRLKLSLSLDEEKSEKDKNLEQGKNWIKGVLQKNMNVNKDFSILRRKINIPNQRRNLNYLNQNKFGKNKISLLKSNKSDSTSDSSINKLSEKGLGKIRKTLSYNDKELNELKFELALKYDNRTFIQIYYSFLKTDHILIKILNSTDYNSLYIKIYLFFYNFSLSYTVNALFFNEDTMHQIFEDEGKFNFIYQLPQILYSSIISSFFGMILNYLALSEDNILALKAERVPQKALQETKNLLKILKTKFWYFFILSFILLVFFWYYVVCFSVVYKNTQFHLLKDSLIGFSTSLLIPFGLKVIPITFRLLGLKYKNHYLFIISKIIQIII